MTGISRTLPLAGRRVAVTSGGAGDDTLSRRLRELGAEVLDFPAIAVGPPASYADLDRALGALGTFGWVAFASAHAVESVAARLAALRLPPPPASVRLAAVGKTTAERLAELVRPADLVPAEARGAGLAAALAPLVRGSRVLLPRAAEGGPELAQGLAAAGAEVVAVAAYRTLPSPPGSLAPLRARLERREVDAVTFASPSAVRSVVGALGPGAPALLAAALVAAIGPTTGDAAQAAGVRVDVQPDEPSGIDLADALAERLVSR